MTLTSSGFAGGPMTDDDFGAIAARGAWVESAAALAVTQPNTGTRTVSVATGAAVAHGVRVKNDAAISQALTAPGSGGQWYLLVLRRDWTTGVKTTTLQVLPGVSTGSTTAPTAAPTALPATFQSVAGVGQADQPLAWVWASSASTTLTIFDLRFVLVLRVLVAATLAALQTLVLHSPAVLGVQMPCLDGTTYRWDAVPNSNPVTYAWRPWDSSWADYSNWGYAGPNVVPAVRSGRWRYHGGRVLAAGLMVLQGGPMGAQLAIDLPVPAAQVGGQDVPANVTARAENQSDSYRGYMVSASLSSAGGAGGTARLLFESVGTPEGTSNPGIGRTIGGSYPNLPFNEAWAVSDLVRWAAEYDSA